MLFSSLLDRSSGLLIKLGMPLVFGYHLICSSLFFNSAASDATGLEKVANIALIPMQYLFEGKEATLENGYYHFERRFDYSRHFFVKTAVAYTLLPLTLPVGATLKALAYLTPKTRERSALLLSSLTAPRRSNLEEYAKMGLKIEDWTQAEFINAPKYKKRLEDGSQLEEDVKALRDVVDILKRENIPFWIDCGSCLGAYRYGGVIPWDWDIDIAVLAPDFENIKRALSALDPEKYAVQDWSGRDRPKTYLKVYVKASNNLIDIYHFGLNPEKQELATILSNELNIFLPSSWVTRELRYTTPMPFTRVFPLKRALFEGIEVPVPGNIEEYLHTFYGENLAPIRIYNEITREYEKDPSHPYWLLPCVH